MSKPANRKTILVVDDEPEIRKLVAAMVAQFGYTVLTADSGDHAMTIYKKQGPIELLITDVVAPGMSGPMLADKLIELQPDLCGRPAPRLRGSALEVADVILALRDHDDSPARTADELGLSTADVLTCIHFHELNPRLVDERIAVCDFSHLGRPGDLVWHAD